MKIRTDFVTNSSSSSFIVAFDKIPESIEELKEMMFSDDEKKYRCFSGPYDGNFFDINVIAEIVFNDIKNQKVNDFKAIKEEFGSFSKYDEDYHMYTKLAYPEYPEYDRTDEKARKKAWDAYSKECEKVKNDAYKNFMKSKSFKGKKLFIFEYSDNSGTLGCAMEHGSLFKKFKYLRVSKH